jgi:glucuronokinase
MLIIRRWAPARAGLVGNPSDGYGGRTISVVVPRFSARATLYEWDEVEIVWSQEDQSRFRSVKDLVQDVKLHGYYGGVRLVKATIKKFIEFCEEWHKPLHDRNFSIRYQTDIPRQVGLGGSSAIVVATLRCLMEFYELDEADIPLRVQPSLALSVEKSELGIAAGLQDRVIQVYGGLVSMDFGRMEKQMGFDCGVYERLDPSLLPPLYVAYRTDASEPTEVPHSRLRERFDRGDRDVVEAMERFAQLAADAREAILARDAARLGELVDANFDQRRKICEIAEKHQEMVERARRAGASAKFAGSGGAIVGICPDQATFERLQAELEPIRCEVVRLEL